MAVSSGTPGHPLSSRGASASSRPAGAKRPLSTSQWTYEYDGTSYGVSPVVIDADNVLFAFSTPDPTTRNQLGNLQSINVVTGVVNWTFQAGRAFNNTPLLSNGVVYAGNSNYYLYAVDVTTGNELWSVALGSAASGTPAVSGNLVFIGTMNGEFLAIDITTHLVQWKTLLSVNTPGETRVGTPAIFENSVITLTSVENAPPSGQGGCAYSFDFSGNPLWTFNASEPISSELLCVEGMVVFGTMSGLVYGVGAGDGGMHWKVGISGQTKGQPGYADGVFYFGSLTGLFYSLPIAAEQDTKPTEYPLGLGAISTGILMQGSYAFFGGADQDGNPFFYTLDVSSTTNRPLTGMLSGVLMFEPNIADGVVAIAALDTDGGEIITTLVDILTLEELGAQSVEPLPGHVEGMLSQTKFTCQLMVDDYDVSGTTTPTPTVPTFQMCLSLTDGNGAPLTSSTVSIWATESTSLNVAGQPEPLSIGTDSTNPATAQVNSAGQLVMTMTGDLGSPGLYFQPDFFLTGYSLLAYPDTGNLLQMIGTQGSDIASATDYSNTPLLQTQYQNQATQNSLASVLQNGAAGFPTSTQVANAASGNAGQRPLSSGATPSWQMSIANAEMAWSALSSDEAARIVAAATAAGPEGLFSHIEDFVRDIIEGGEQLAKLTWTAIEDGIQIIANGVTSVYSFAISTIDDAITVLTGIIQQVVTSIKSFIEWLSYLFQWPAIVKTHQLISAQVTTAFNAISTWVNQEISSGYTDVDQFFTARENDVTTLFDNIITQFTGKTMGSIQSSNGQTSVTSINGTDITTHSQWMVNKYNANAGSASMVVAGALDDVDILALVQNFFTTIETEIANDSALTSLPADFAGAITNFSTLFTDTTGFLNHELADILTLFKDVAILAIQLASNVVNAFLLLLQGIINALLDALTTEISIPFLSDFYKLISGDALTVLDLVCLIVAVPTTIAYEIVTGGDTPSVTSVVPVTETTYNWMAYAYAFSLGLMLVPWMIADLADFPTPAIWLIAGGSAVTYSLSLGVTEQANPAATDYLLYAMQMFSAAMPICGLKASSQSLTAWKATAPAFYGFYGGWMLMSYAVYAALYPKAYLDPDGMTFVSNAIGCLPYLGQPLAYIQADDVGPAAVALCDFFGYGTASVIAFATYWTQ
ncbi:MAG: PQQ-binding-like beta-propeller repeat protein [Acidobacteriota bacterium]